MKEEMEERSRCEGREFKVFSANTSGISLYEKEGGKQGDVEKERSGKVKEDKFFHTKKVARVVDIRVAKSSVYLFFLSLID